jgi:hypothetical protein
MRSILGSLLWTAALSVQSVDVSGKWLGTLEPGGVKLRLALHIEKTADGYQAKMDSIDQGASGIPVSDISVTGTEFRFQVPKIAGRYEGKISADQKEISGTWSQGPASLPLTFARTNVLPASGPRPQEPKKPYPYEEIEVSYENAAQKIKLAGTLTIPRQGRPVPAVLLLTGSGPQDRDESLMGHKPFLVLADHLTRRGIAVLRVDDRGVGGSTGSVQRSTSGDFAADALAGVAFLKSRSEIDAARIGLVGHSEGGIVASIAASQSKDVAYIVLLAGTGVTGEEILYVQAEMLARASGVADAGLAANRARQSKLFAILRAEQDNAEAEKKLRAVIEESAALVSGEERKKAFDPAMAQVRTMLTPWFRSFLTLDPSAYLRKVTCPVLALNGEIDLQVSSKQNLPAIARALEEGGNRAYTIRKFAGLNHLFQTAKTGAVSEYAQIEETMAPLVLETISQWILQQAANR